MISLFRARVFRYCLAIFAAVAASIFFVPAIHEHIFAKDFLPHATCYLRNPKMIWLHVTSDLVIGFSYVAISSTLAYLVHRARKEIPFHWMFLAFGLFIVMCGFTHFMEVWTVWKPFYWLAGDVKLVTAVASATTAILLPPLVPKIFDMIVSAKKSESRRAQLEAARAESEELTNRLRSRTAELEDANKELNAFNYAVAHDVRAPLRTMSGMADILLQEEGAHLNAQSQQLLQRIVNGAARLQTLTSDLLAYAAISRDHLPLAPVALRPLIVQSIEALNVDIVARHATVTVEDGFPEVLGNPSLLSQIFNNIIINAVKYVPADRAPIIRVWCERRGNKVRVWVEDNGPGVPQEFQRKIFEPFERLHDNNHISGTGIGLAIVERAIQRMGGTVGVESRAGEGSRFWVELPLNELKVAG